MFVSSLSDNNHDTVNRSAFIYQNQLARTGLHVQTLPPAPQHGRPRNPPRKHHRPSKHRRNKILGQARPDPQSPNQFLPLSHTLPIRPPHPHNRFLLLRLSKRDTPRLPPPQWQIRTLNHTPLHRLSPLSACPPLRTRVCEPLTPETIDVSAACSELE